MPSKKSLEIEDFVVVQTQKCFDDQIVPKSRSGFLSSHYFNFDITRTLFSALRGIKKVSFMSV